MNNADFVHLHCHTEYSRFDGLAKMLHFVGTARAMGFRAIACSDHGNIGGWIKFYKACTDTELQVDKKTVLDASGKPAGPIKPILACEFYLARDHAARGREQQPDGRKGNRHILLIAKNYEGYQNLCRLSQLSWTDGQAFSDPRIDLNQLAAHSNGLICSTACLGSIVNINLLHGRYQQAKKAVSVLKDIFDRDLYLSTMCHGIDAEMQIIPDQIKLAEQMGCLLVAENDTHYVTKEQARSQEVLMATSTSRCMKDPRRIHFPHDEFYLKSADEMAKMYGTSPKILTNSVEIAERVEDVLAGKKGGMRLPNFDLEEAQKAIAVHSGEADVSTSSDIYIDKDMTPMKFLEQEAWKGMQKLSCPCHGKWDKSPAHLEAYKRELADMHIAWDNNKMDFFTYFLIDWDIMRFARLMKILTGCGRGSGYASIILRCLGVNYGPCPIEHGLIWERFLGFDEKFFLLDTDWGLGSEEGMPQVLATDELDEERAVEDDQGGVDRY
jgi:DNA polymerase-3 subunit alpha